MRSSPQAGWSAALRHTVTAPLSAAGCRRRDEGHPNKISMACGASNKGRCFEDIPSIKLPNEMTKLAEHILCLDTWAFRR
jgi:hypothetical protein